MISHITAKEEHDKASYRCDELVARHVFLDELFVDILKQKTNYCMESHYIPTNVVTFPTLTAYGKASSVSCQWQSRCLTQRSRYERSLK